MKLLVEGQRYRKLLPRYITGHAGTRGGAPGHSDDEGEEVVHCGVKIVGGKPADDSLNLPLRSSPLRSSPLRSPPLQLSSSSSSLFVLSSTTDVVAAGTTISDGGSSGEEDEQLPSPQSKRQRCTSNSGNIGKQGASRSRFVAASLPSPSSLLVGSGNKMRQERGVQPEAELRYSDVGGEIQGDALVVEAAAPGPDMWTCTRCTFAENEVRSYRSALQSDFDIKSNVGMAVQYALLCPRAMASLKCANHFRVLSP